MPAAADTMNAVGLSPDLNNISVATGASSIKLPTDGVVGVSTNNVTASTLSPARPLPSPNAPTAAPHLSPNSSNCLPSSSTTPNRATPQLNRLSESSSRDDGSTNDDDASSYSPFVDEEFMKHYNVKEIQNNVVNSLVDEEFLRHYRVDEIAASLGFNGQYSGNYGYDYFMGGKWVQL